MTRTYDRNRQRRDVSGRIEIHPNARIDVRLPQKKSVRGSVPKADFVDFVVEDEISSCRPGGQDGVSLPFLVANNRH